MGVLSAWPVSLLVAGEMLQVHHHKVIQLWLGDRAFRHTPHGLVSEATHATAFRIPQQDVHMGQTTPLELYPIHMRSLSSCCSRRWNERATWSGLSLPGLKAPWLAPVSITWGAACA
jgi:hypothetical protein